MTGFDNDQGRQSRRLGRTVERPDRAGRRGRALAGPCRRRLLLSEHISARGIARVDLDLRLGDLARLSLLLRPCDVGHRDVRGSAALAVLQPDAAGAILDYRIAQPGGRASQRALRGRRGLQFPWESAPRSGEEAAPMPGAAAWHEDHVSLDIARAFSLYADVTGDMEFLRTQAWPVLSGVAEWLTSRVTPTASGYDIAQSMGIAEREQPVCNAAFTNMGAVVVLRAALAARGATGLRRRSRLGAARRRHRHPPARQGDHLPRRLSNQRGEGRHAGPADGHFPVRLPSRQARASDATLALYLKSAEDYIGSPMLSALYGAWAARAGDRDLALELLDEGYGQFCVGRFLQTLEYRADRFPEQPQAGPFFANIGGFLTGLMFGFTGLEPGPDAPDAWSRRAVNLPAGWSAIEIERLWIRGNRCGWSPGRAKPRPSSRWGSKSGAFFVARSPRLRGCCV